MRPRSMWRSRRRSCTTTGGCRWYTTRTARRPCPGSTSSPAGWSPAPPRCQIDGPNRPAEPDRRLATPCTGPGPCRLGARASAQRLAAPRTAHAAGAPASPWLAALGKAEQQQGSPGTSVCCCKRSRFVPCSHSRWTGGSADVQRQQPARRRPSCFHPCLCCSTRPPEALDANPPRGTRQWLTVRPPG